MIIGGMLRPGTADSAPAHVRSNLTFDQGFEGDNPWGAFQTTQDNLGVGGNTWAREQLFDHPNEGLAYFKAEVRSGCDGCKSSGYRSEILPVGHSDTNNTVQWYGFSIYFDTPQSGGIWRGNSAGHFWQWHPSSSTGSATLALYNDYPNTGDGWTLAVNPTGDGGTHYQSDIPITASTWHHVVFKVFWGTSNNGYVKVWINGTLFWNITNLDFNTSGRYLKIGMNRWNWSGSGCSGCSTPAPTSTWKIGYDNIRIGNSSATYNDVAPVFKFPEPS